MTIDWKERERKTREAFKGLLHWSETIPLHYVEPYPFDDEYICFEVKPPSEIQGNEIATSCVNMLRWEDMEVPSPSPSHRLEEIMLREARRIAPFFGVTVPEPPVVPKKFKGDAHSHKLSFLYLHQSKIPLTFARSFFPEDDPMFDVTHFDLNTVHLLEPDEIEPILHYLEEKVSKRLSDNEKVPLSTRIHHHILSIYDIGTDGIDFQKLEVTAGKMNSWLTLTRERCNNLQREELKNRADALHRIYFSAYKVLVANYRFFKEAKLLGDKDFEGFVKEDCEVTMTTSEMGIEHLLKNQQGEALQDFHYLLLYYLHYAWINGYRKRGNMVYEPRKLKNGNWSFEFAQMCEMKSFIQRPFQNFRDQASEVWKWAWKRGNLEKLIAALVVMEDPRFPILIKDRTLFAYEDCIYSTQMDYAFSMDEVRSLPFEGRKVAVAKYHEGLRFQNEFLELILDKTDGDWYAIPTPYLSRILDSQGFPEDVKRFVFMCMGRMFQRLGTDNWQFILWLIGKSGTGKSTLCLILAAFFASEDVGTLASNVEPKFGMQTFFDPFKKFLVIAPDLGRGFGLPLPTILNWISAEKGLVPRKGREALDIEYDIPFIACSNYVVLGDKKDALGRRVVYLRFDKAIQKSNTKMAKLVIEHELPMIMKKCTRAYIDYLQRFGELDIWDTKVMPPYFQMTRKDLAAESNSIRYWLTKSEQVEIISDYTRETRNIHNNLICTPLDYLGNQYKAWKKDRTAEQKLTDLDWTAENYMPVFQELGCDVFEYNGHWPPYSRLENDYLKQKLMVQNVVTKMDNQMYQTQLDAERKKIYGSAGAGSKSSLSASASSSSSSTTVPSSLLLQDINPSASSEQHEDSPPTSKPYRGSKRKQSPTIQDILQPRKK